MKHLSGRVKSTAEGTNFFCRRFTELEQCLSDHLHRADIEQEYEFSGVDLEIDKYVINVSITVTRL